MTNGYSHHVFNAKKKYTHTHIESKETKQNINRLCTKTEMIRLK